MGYDRSVVGAEKDLLMYARVPSSRLNQRYGAAPERPPTLCSWLLLVNVPNLLYQSDRCAEDLWHLLVYGSIVPRKSEARRHITPSQAHSMQACQAADPSGLALSKKTVLFDEKSPQ